MDRVEKANQLFTELHEKDDMLEFDLEYKMIMNHYIYGDVYQHGNLDIHIRELIILVVQTTNASLKQLKEHTFMALNAGVSPVEIKEAIYQCTPYIGYAKVENALEVINEVFLKKGIALPLESQSMTTEETRFEKGFAVQTTAFDKEAIQAGHDNAPKELKHIQNFLSEYCFGDFYTRKGLDLKTRELLTFVMLATLGGCENQLKAHTQANIRVGNTRDDLIETITQCQPYIGFPRTLNAINIINEVTLHND